MSSSQSKWCLADVTAVYKKQAEPVGEVLDGEEYKAKLPVGDLGSPAIDM
jgi:hypothetical protein